MSAQRGRFVVLEGGDGSGKSTQVAALVARLGAAGVEVVTTFEPGATPVGAAIRALLLDGSDPVDPVAEALLMAADRAQHVATVVEPALARGVWVVSDRFVPSSLVYQGAVREVGVAAVEELNRFATGALAPDLVVVLDVDDDVAEARAGAVPDRMEAEGRPFHASVREAYRSLAVDHGWTVVDGNGLSDQVAERIWAAVAPLLAR
jgi:dTMP kinase